LAPILDTERYFLLTFERRNVAVQYLQRTTEGENGMNQTLVEALAELQGLAESRPINVERYRALCEVIIDHRNELTHRVYINTPDNIDPRWARVRENSDSRCGCGCDRVILPGNPRKTLEAAAGEPMVLSQDGNKVYLKSVGGDKSSTHMALWIEASDEGEKMLCFTSNPFAPFVLSVSMFSTPGFKLSKLAEVLPKQTKPPVMVSGKEETPLFAILAVDPDAGTVTISLDRAVECLTKEAIERLPTHAH